MVSIISFRFSNIVICFSVCLRTKMGQTESFSRGCSGSSSSSYTVKDPEGTHTASCIAGSSGWMNTLYEEHCPGCRGQRANSAWGQNTSGNLGTGIIDILGIGKK